MSNKRLILVSAVFLTSFSFCVMHAVSQEAVGAFSSVPASKDKSRLLNPAGWETAENSWRSQAVDVDAQVDPVPPALRQIRNKVWSNTLAEFLGLEKRGMHLSSSTGLPMRLDLKPDPQGFLVLATFEGYTVVPTDPDRLVMYTEMHFRLQTVVQQPPGATLAAGGLIDSDILGGRVKTSSGEMRSFHVSPRRYFVQPGSTYLLMTRYVRETASYTLGAFWKVERGVITSGYDSRSPFIGVALNDVISKIKYVAPQP